MKTALDQRLADFDPFADDKDDGGWSRERKEVVRTRSEHRCVFSDEPHVIPIGIAGRAFYGGSGEATAWW